jgi:Mrp family chromosome partitioning ATPase
MRELILRLEQAFDTIIIDAPPLLPVTDAAVLSQHVGGVVVVVGSSKLKHQDLQKSLSALEMVGANLLGVVLNRLPVKGPDAYTYSYYSNDKEPPAVQNGRRNSTGHAQVLIETKTQPTQPTHS